MPSKARGGASGDKRSLTGGLSINLDVPRAGEAMAKVSKFGRAIQQLSEAYGSTVKEAKEFDWASRGIGKTHSVLKGQVLKTYHLYNVYGKELEAVGDGTIKVSSLTNDQIEVFKELHDVTNKLLEQDRVKGFLDRNQRKGMVETNQQMGEIRNQIARVQEAEEKLSGASKFLGGVWAESFGKLKTGSEEADKVLGIFSSAFGKIQPIIKPHLDRIKRMMADTVSEKLGFKTNDDEILASIELFKEKMAKKSELAKTPVHLLRQGDLGDLGGPETPESLLQDASVGAGGLEKTVKTATKVAKAMDGAKSSTREWADGLGSSIPIARKVAGAMGKVGASGAATGGVMTKVAGAFTKVVTPARVLMVAMVALDVGMKLLAEGFQLNIEAMEKFRTTGFRAAGSIRELIDTSSNLIISLGSNSQQAFETVTAIAQAGFAVDTLNEKLKTASGEFLHGQDALLRLAETNLMFADATGASAVETALLQKRLNVMGTTAEDQEAILGALAEATEKYGLTGAEVTGMVQSLRKNSLLLEKVWKGTNIYEYTRMMGTLSGAVKRLGLDASVASEIMNDLSKATSGALKIAAMGGGLGAFFKNDQVKQMEALAVGAANILEDAEKMAGIKKIYYLEAFGGVEKLEALAAVQEALIEERKLFDAMSKSEQIRHKTMEKSREAMEKGYHKATSSFSRAWQKVTAPIMGLFMKISGPLISAIADALAWLAPPIIKMAQELGKMWDDMAEAFEPIKPELIMIGKLLGLVLLASLKGALMLVKGLILAFQLVAYSVRLIMNPLQAVEDLINWISDQWSELGSAEGMSFLEGLESDFKRIASGVMDVADALLGLVPFVSLVYKAFKTIWELLFQSSFLHIEEGISGILPSLRMLWNFISFLATPFEWVTNAAERLFDLFDADMIKNFFMDLDFGKILKGLVTAAIPGGGLLSLAADFLGFENEEPQKAVEKSTTPLTPANVESESPKTVYTVKFADDLMTNEAENKSVSTASMVEIAKLMKMMVSREDDVNIAKSAVSLENIEQILGDTSSKKVKPGITSSKRVFGEKLNRWW